MNIRIVDMAAGWNCGRCTFHFNVLGINPQSFIRINDQRTVQTPLFGVTVKLQQIISMQMPLRLTPVLQNLPLLNI